jgi:hypothetical protein
VVRHPQLGVILGQIGQNNQIGWRLDRQSRAVNIPDV